jgi:two-component system response regulator GlrR
MADSGITIRAGTPGREIQRFRVAVVAGADTGLTWARPNERCAIGSHPLNDLVLTDSTVSRFHCELSIAGNLVAITDLGSRNGTLAHGIALERARLPGGTELVLGHTHVVVQVDDERAQLAASERTSFGALSGESAVMREIFSTLERVAASEATVLIEGETGTGKEGVAEALHAQGPRASGPFVVVDCGAVPGALLESELFGHERGAFTGAEERRIGAFERASGGTLFLDELGELPPDLQPKLLRVLESRRIRRVGGHASIDCDVRIVAATNRDLRAEVNRGTFRPDLFYRVAVVKVVLPPLRERPGDVRHLATRLLTELGASRVLMAALTDDDYLAALESYAWPGNVRELRNHLERCVVFGEAMVPNETSAPRPAAPAATSQTYEIARRQALDEFERAYVIGLLERTQDNVAAAAREAGVNRTYIHRLIRRHRLR